VIALGVKYRVKQLAKERGMTQFELAVKSGVSMSAIRLFWVDRVPDGVRYSTLTAIAAALGVTIDDLTTSEDDSARVTLRANKESLIAA
jgi:transcriptional regulator with XRE-family HTH domain